MLGVPPDATKDELHAAWRRQLRYWHPDRHNHPDALEHSKLINQAHDVLTDPQRRADYDRKRAASGWRPPSAGSGRVVRESVTWKVVHSEGPVRAAAGFDHHGFVARLENLMNRGRLMVERRKDLASRAKWEAQTLTMLRDELGDHPYKRAFEAAIRDSKPEDLVSAYGVLWAVYEDALKGDLRPAPKNKTPSR